MRITKGKLRETLRRVIQESMAQQDIMYLGNLLKSYPGTFFDWSEFCVWYDDLMIDLRAQYGEMMDDFLYSYDLEECPEHIKDLLYVINLPEAQGHPMYTNWATELRANF